MTDLFAAIEGSALATWTRESPSIWAYPTILTLHTFGLAIVVGANTVLDFRLLGFGRRIPVAALHSLFPVMWWAFLLNFVTGVLLFMSDATHKSTQGVFYVKLGLIGLALLTVKGVRTALNDAAAQTTGRARNLAILSLALWTGAIIAGRLMAYL